MATKRFADRVAEAIHRLSPELQACAHRDVDRLQQASLLTERKLRRLIQDRTEDPVLRGAAAWVAGLIQDSSLADALERSVDERQPVMFLWEAAKTLSAFGKGAALFKRFLVESRDPEVRKLAAFGLGRLRDPSAVTFLMSVLEAPHEEPSVRGQAAEALGYLGDKSALDVLLSSAVDPVPEVRFWSAFALGQLGDMRALPILEKMVSSDHFRVDGWWEISREAADAVNEIRRAK